MSKLHPTQPLELDNHGTLRFKENKIVSFLLNAGPFDLNQLALMSFTNEDREQLAQLIGYSLSGFGDLSYVSDETYERAGEEEVKGKDNLEDAASQLGLTKKQVLTLWRTDKAHFGWTAPHRYCGKDYCCYCLRPKGFSEDQEE